jgi:hypothetical protein
MVSLSQSHTVQTQRCEWSNFIGLSSASRAIQAGLTEPQGAASRRRQRSRTGTLQRRRGPLLFKSDLVGGTGELVIEPSIVGYEALVLPLGGVVVSATGYFPGFFITMRSEL